MNKVLHWLLFMCLSFPIAHAQTDTTGLKLSSPAKKPTDIRIDANAPAPFSVPKQKKAKNPVTATWLSVVLPGAGQVYNGHWYKVPIIYGGAAALVYFGVINRRESNFYMNEYRIRKGVDSLHFPRPDLARYTDENILTLRENYQRNFELVLILSGVLYILNIIDACVFAHLSTFDVSENLSLRVQPYAQPDYSVYSPVPIRAGLSLQFTLK